MDATAASRPLLEPDRFFAAPRRGMRRGGDGADAQRLAVERLVQRCAQLRPHLRSVDELEAFIRAQPDPGRTRRRISLALAIEVPGSDRAYGMVGRRKLETFRNVALQRPAAIVWVFT
jgi:hypothetical protein